METDSSVHQKLDAYGVESNYVSGARIFVSLAGINTLIR